MQDIVTEIDGREVRIQTDSDDYIEDVYVDEILYQTDDSLLDWVADHQDEIEDEVESRKIHRRPCFPVNENLGSWRYIGG